MKRYLQGISLALFMPFMALGQSNHLVKGRVTDQKTGEPLYGAEITTTVKGEGTLSNQQGFYQILTQSTRIQVKYAGYAIASAQIQSNSGDTVPLNFALAEEEALLEQVVVSANKSRQRITEATMSIESIKPYLIENKNPVTIDQIADQIPGVQINDKQINIRGGSGWSYGTGSRALVLVDGLPMLSGDAGSVLWNFITLENVKNIELLKGASSVLFGSSAMNGILNIQTKNPGTTPETEIVQFTGVYDLPREKGLKWQGDRLLSTSGIRVYHGFRKNANEWSLTANLFNDDGYRMGDFDRRARVGARYRWVPSQKNMVFSLNTSAQIGQNASFLIWQHLDSGYTALNQAITQTRALRFHIDPSFTIFRKKSKHSIVSRYLFVDNQIDNGDVDNNQNNASHLWYSEYQHSFSPKKPGMKINSGVVFNSVVTMSPLFQGDQKSQNIAVYSQIDKKWARHSFNIGGRLEHYGLNEYRETKPVFRSGWQYQPWRFTFLRASFGQGYRFPTISEAYISTTVGPLRIFPNASLKSETGWNAEIGCKQAFAFGGIKGFADLSLFWTQYQNMMEFTFGQWSSDISVANGFGAGFKSINTGETRIRGAEISVNGEGRWGRSYWRFLSGYTFMDSRSLSPLDILTYDSVGNPLTFRNTSSDTSGDILKYRPSHILKADIQTSIGRWELGASTRFTGYIHNIDKAFVAFPLSLFVKDIQKGRELHPKGVWIYDLRVGFHLDKKFKINLTVQNVFNTIYMMRPADLRPPRSYSLQLLIKV